MTLVKLRFSPYAGTRAEWREIEATVRGDLAVHRSAYILPEREGGGLSIGKTWTVSHIPSGDTIESVFPVRFRNRGGCVARKRDLVAWAEAFQAACPAFFDAARSGDKEAMRACLPATLDIARRL